MLAIPVPGGPAPKALRASANRWVEVITRALGGKWLAGDDERLRVAFDLVEERATWWPTVGAVIAELPPRKPGLGLPMTKAPDEKWEEGHEVLRGLVKAVCSHVDLPEVDRVARLRLLSRQAQELQAGVHD